MFSFTFHLRQLMSELASVMNSLPYLAASCARMASSSGKSCAFQRRVRAPKSLIPNAAHSAHTLVYV